MSVIAVIAVAAVVLVVIGLHSLGFQLGEALVARLHPVQRRIFTQS